MNIDFTNELYAVSPTGITTRYMPYLMMLAAGLILAALTGSNGIRRRRRKDRRLKGTPGGETG